MRHTIGVIDSGMGGLTVVRSLFRLGAPVDIVYVGDNANMPYGNRPVGEIVALTGRMLKMLEARDVEIVAIACNTISATVGQLKNITKLPLIDIISLGASYLASRGERDVGLFATEFTVNSGLHASHVRALASEVRVHGIASATLAARIDSSPDDERALRAEISSMLARLAAGAAGAAAPIHTVLLGCTHYPIVMDIFKSLAPAIDFIDPAELQAKAICAQLGIECASGEREKTRGSSLEIMTSGSLEAYRAMLARLGIPMAQRFQNFEA